MTTPSRALSDEQRRALDILAGCPNGCTEGALRARGFTVRLLAAIVRAGLALHEREIGKDQFVRGVHPTDRTVVRFRALLHLCERRRILHAP
jgi:hypothetical protein